MALTSGFRPANVISQTLSLFEHHVVFALQSCPLAVQLGRLWQGVGAEDDTGEEEDSRQKQYSDEESPQLERLSRKHE